MREGPCGAWSPPSRHRIGHPGTGAGPVRTARGGQDPLAIGAHAELAVRPAQRISRIATRKKVAYLTFDDGPDPRWTPQVTEVLRKHRVKGTFFVVGNAAQRHPRMVRTLRSQGHVVANHSYSHPVLTRQSSSAVRSQLQRTDRAIGSSRCYRTPYGSVNRRVDTVAGSLGIRYSVLWNVDSNDWRRPGATTIANTVCAPPGRAASS